MPSTSSRDLVAPRFASLSLALFALVSAPAGALEPALSRPTTGELELARAPVGDTTDGALELAQAAALEAIRTDRIRADLEFLADDRLAGRDSPSPGLEIAARYLRARVARLGFEPGVRGGYFHTYPVEVPGLDPEGTRAVLRTAAGETNLHWGHDYYLPLGRMSARGYGDVSVDAEVVYCGAGDREELEAAELEGRWALCLDEGQRLSKLRTAVRRAGAVGLLLTPGPTYTGAAYWERFAKDTEVLSQGRVRQPSGSDESREVFPVVALEHFRSRVIFDAGDELSVGRVLPDVRFVSERVSLPENGRRELENVCALWPGSDPELQREVILISAHYDHIGARDGKIWNGADDNGSGTSGLLAIADALAVHGPLRRSVMLIWVSGEEKGLWGSAAWANDPTLPEGYRAVCNINIDMIGRNAPDELLITPTKALEQYNGLTRLAEANASAEGFRELGSADAYWSRSDHAEFARLGIPVAFLFADVHEDYHQHTDTIDKIEFDKIRRSSRLVLRIVFGLQTDELKL